MAGQSHEVKLLRLLRWLLHNFLAMTEKPSHATAKEPNQDIKHLLSSKVSPVTVTESCSSSNISKMITLNQDIQIYKNAILL